MITATALWDELRAERARERTIMCDVPLLIVRSDEPDTIGGYFAGSIITYRHDRPDGDVAHILRGDGSCLICGISICPPETVTYALDQTHQRG